MEIELDPLAGENGGAESARLAAFWHDQIEKCGKDKKYAQFLKRGRKVEQRYRDERNRADEDERRRYNSLWANVEILKPAIYGRSPVPLAERRFGDKDPIALGAAQILERALRNEIEICGFHEAMCQAVNDYLLPGRGVAWVRYAPEFSEGISLHAEDSIDMKDDQGPLEPDLYGEDGELLDQTSEKLEATDDEIARESTPVDYIHWEDFFTFPVNARTWSEVVAVGKRVYMTYAQMAERFGRDIARKIPLQKDERLKFTYENVTIEHEVKGEVYEIWNKEDRTVYWVADGYSFLMDRKADPLNLEHFFPCPRPIIANQTNGTLIPVADYIEYQDQATQIDDLSQRIAMLIRACKVAGVYDAASRGIRRLLDESVENELIPVDNWAAFAEKGGIAGQISFLPLKEIIGVLNQLVQMKQMLIEEMDRLTGINDLMRGTNDARETLGGVRLKSNYTGTRLTARQNEVARFARDLVRIMADIMCQHFAPKSLVEASGAMFEEGLGVNVDDVEDQMAATKPPAPAAPQMPPQQQQLPAPQPMGGNVVPFQPRIGGLPVSVGPHPGMPMPSMPLQAPPVAPGLPALPTPSPLQLAIQQALGRIDRAIALLRNERLRGFRVDIEVDSTIYGDAAQEKGDRNEFVEVVTKYLQTAMQMTTQIPEITPLLGKLLQFAVRGYRVGRDLESSIEEFCDQATKIVKQRQQQAQSQPNPEMIKAQAEAETARATATSAQTRAQADVAKSHADIATAQINAAANKQQAASEFQRQQLDAQTEAQNQQMDLAIKNMEMKMRAMEVEIEQMRLLTRVHQAQQPPVDQGGLGNERGMPNRNAV